jgi:tetratricopeptide (TPR) repeat protein
MGALDEMLTAWRGNPDAERTIALCSYLGVMQSEDLIREVGARAEAWHQGDAEVMLAVGRMYLEAGFLPEAQAALVLASKANGRDARPFRYLGEVLLRRGDAVRSEKVLARARQLAPGDASTRLWHDRAGVYVALQNRAGISVVAAEVARTLPTRSAVALPVIVPESYPGDEEPTRPGGRRRSLTGPTPVVSASGRAARLTPPPPQNRSNDVPLPAFDLPQSGGEIGSAPSHRSPGGGRGNGGFSHVPFSQPQLTSQRNGSLSSYEEVTEIDEMFIDDPNPEPALVFEHLARVGVFEPGGGAAPVWERPARTRNRGSWVLALATVLLIGGGAGAYVYTKDLKQQRIARAQSLTREVATLLHSGGVTELQASDAKLSQIFELDSRSKAAARLWLENRVLGALILPSESRGIDSAVHRALSVGLSEEQVAFGRIAAFLVEGDLAGAAALLPKWDTRASKDAYYQLLAGAALEAAGDLRALERYEAARTLDAKLVIAEVLLARLALLELGPDKGRPMVEALKLKLGDIPTTRALSALLWAVEPDRPKELPAGVAIHPDDVERLPAPLRVVPPVLQALQAIDQGEPEKASEAIAAGIPSADSPGAASWLGFLAIAAGDEQLARKAALRALAKAAVYPRARVLAARVALLGGRLDEAKKAVEQLEPSAPEVAVVRAAVAYETLDVTELESALTAMGDSAKTRPELGALSAAPHVLAGTAYPKADALLQMARPQVPWGELVAADAALDSGNLRLAEQIVKAWADDAARPVYMLRVARLRRYQGRADEAVKNARHALEQGTTTARTLVECIYDELANRDVQGARELLAKYPTLLGPMTSWLSALVDVAANRKADAAVKVAQLEPVSDAAPMLLRLLVARALSASGDKRATAYLRGLSRGAGRNPDFIEAAKAAE